MVKNNDIFVLIHIHFKKKSSAQNNKNHFLENLQNYVATEYKKSKVGKTRETKTGMQINIPDVNMSFGLEKDTIHIMISCIDSSKISLSVDKILNKILMFIDTSEQKIDQIMTTFSKTISIKNDPMMKLINREAIMEFSTKIKKSFKPRAIHLTTGVEEISGREQEFSVMVSHDEDELELEMTVETRSSGIIPLDFMVKNNKTINENKNKVYTALGVRES